MTDYVERDGEILPSYTGVNQPRYHGIDPIPSHEIDEVQVPDNSEQADQSSAVGQIALGDQSVEMPESLKDMASRHRSRYPNGLPNSYGTGVTASYFHRRGHF